MDGVEEVEGRSIVYESKYRNEEKKKIEEIFRNTRRQLKKRSESHEAV